MLCNRAQQSSSTLESLFCIELDCALLSSISETTHVGGAGFGEVCSQRRATRERAEAEECRGRRAERSIFEVAVAVLRDE